MRYRVSIVTIGLLITLGLLLTTSRASPPVHAAGVDHPQQLSSWSDPDHFNPGRGQYVWDPVSRWHRDTPVTRTFPEQSAVNAVHRPWSDVSTYYTRISWADLERSDGDASGGYDFSMLERRIALAASRGQRTVFRVMTIDPGSYSVDVSARAFPEYIARTAGEYPVDPQGISAPRFPVPHFNAPEYQQAFTDLIRALGKRYDLDPRVAGLDISGYGTWGEWNTMGWGDTIPDRIDPAFVARLVDTHLEAFPHTRLYSLTDESLLPIAMTKSQDIGIRVDCLGHWSGGGAWTRLLAQGAAAQRWRNAPVATEYCATNYHDGTEAEKAAAVRYPWMAEEIGSDDRLFANARRQVPRWHVSLVSSGNFVQAESETEPLTPDQYEDFSRAAKYAGYQYAVTNARFPDQVAGGTSVSVRLDWANFGSAPFYDRTESCLELRPAGTTSISSAAAIPVNLKPLVGEFDESQDTPAVARTTTTTTLDIPAGLPPGRYDVAVSVWPRYDKDLTGLPAWTAPLRLAQEGRADDGHYVLGTIDVT